MARADWDMFDNGTLFESSQPRDFGRYPDPNVLALAQVPVVIDEFTPKNIVLDSNINFPDNGQGGGGGTVDRAQVVIDPGGADYVADYNGKDGDTVLKALVGEFGAGSVVVAPGDTIALRNQSLKLNEPEGTGFWRRNVNDVPLTVTEGYVSQHIGLTRADIPAVAARIKNPIVHIIRWSASGDWWGIALSAVQATDAQHVIYDRCHLLRYRASSGLFSEIKYWDLLADGGAVLDNDGAGLGHSRLTGDPNLGGTVLVRYARIVDLSGVPNVLWYYIDDSNTTKLPTPYTVVDPLGQIAMGGMGFGQIGDVTDVSIWEGAVVPTGFADADVLNLLHWEIDRTRIDIG